MPTTKRNPVLAVMSTLAALQVMVAGSALTDVIGARLAGLLGLMVAAVQMGMQFYVRGQVTPYETVVAQVSDAGQIVAGPAAQTTTGAPVEEPVPSPADAGHADLMLLAVITAGVFLGGLILHLVLT